MATALVGVFRCTFKISSLLGSSRSQTYLSDSTVPSQRVQNCNMTPPHWYFRRKNNGVMGQETVIEVDREGGIALGLDIELAEGMVWNKREGAVSELGDWSSKVCTDGTVQRPFQKKC